MNIRAIHMSAAALVLSTAAGWATANDHFSRRSEAPDALEGTWQVRVTPYVCGSDPIVSFPQFAVASTVEALQQSGVGKYDLPAFLRKQAD